MKLFYSSDKENLEYAYPEVTAFGEGILLTEKDPAESIVYEVDLYHFTPFIKQYLGSDLDRLIARKFCDKDMTMMSKFSDIKDSFIDELKNEIFDNLPKIVAEKLASLINANQEEKANIEKEVIKTFAEFDLIEVSKETFLLKRESLSLKKDDGNTIRNAIDYILDHVSLLKGRKDKWEEMEKLFPQHVYHGIAYRAVIANKSEDLGEERLLSPYRSWSISKDGVKSFLSNHPRSHYDNKKVFLVEANIKGISVVHILREILRENYRVSGVAGSHIFKFEGEEEVVLLENFGIINTEEIDLSTYKFTHI